MVCVCALAQGRGVPVVMSSLCPVNFRLLVTCALESTYESLLSVPIVVTRWGCMCCEGRGESETAASKVHAARTAEGDQEGARNGEG